MAKKLTKLQKYNRIYRKYRNKIKKLAEEYGKKVAEELNGEFIDYYENDNQEFRPLYYRMRYKDIEYQIGDFDCRFYNGGFPRLDEILEKEKE